MKVDFSKKYKAYYEVEINTPLHDSEDNLNDLSFGSDLINAVGDCHSTGAGFGYRDAVGDANFETPQEAYQWKIDTIAIVNEEFPEGSYAGDCAPVVFCGLKILGLDKESLEEETYGELIKNEEGELVISVDSEHSNPDELPVSLFVIEDTVSSIASDEATEITEITEIERQLITEHHQELGSK